MINEFIIAIINIIIYINNTLKLFIIFRQSKAVSVHWDDMECGIQRAMLSVPPVAVGADHSPQQQPISASVFAPPDTDQAQFEADKRAVYK